MQHLTGTPDVDILRIIAELIDLLLRLDRRDRDHLPFALDQHMADQIILVQPLQDDHDGTGALVVQAGVKAACECHLRDCSSAPAPA
jgi:hypothetical protein